CTIRVFGPSTATWPASPASGSHSPAGSCPRSWRTPVLIAPTDGGSSSVSGRPPSSPSAMPCVPTKSRRCQLKDGGDEQDDPAAAPRTLFAADALVPPTFVPEYRTPMRQRRRNMVEEGVRRVSQGAAGARRLSCNRNRLIHR